MLSAVKAVPPNDGLAPAESHVKVSAAAGIPEWLIDSTRKATQVRARKIISVLLGERAGSSVASLSLRGVGQQVTSHGAASRACGHGLDLPGQPDHGGNCPPGTVSDRTR